MKQSASLPPQHQEHYPGTEKEMIPRPRVKAEWYRGSGKLSGKTALITGGDSGIGRAVAVLFAREGASIAIVYLNEHEDAKETKRMVEEEGQKCVLLAGDITSEDFCRECIGQTVRQLGSLDILVNNAVYEKLEGDILKVTEEEIDKSFRTNIYSFFFLSKYAVPHMKPGASIINTTSVNAYKGNGALLTYSSTKGAIVSFTRSLAESLMEKGIRVNAVAPGPIWTPLIPSTAPAENVPEFGQGAPMKRPGEPEEVSPSYVFLASRDSSYMSGQVLHPNGGTAVNG
jgi:NAD(P)-dependent dehydrogenase (short-subunit alcohol dehydrogenase family)